MLVRKTINDSLLPEFRGHRLPVFALSAYMNWLLLTSCGAFRVFDLTEKSPAADLTGASSLGFSSSVHLICCKHDWLSLDFHGAILSSCVRFSNDDYARGKSNPDVGAAAMKHFVISFLSIYSSLLIQRCKLEIHNHSFSLLPFNSKEKVSLHLSSINVWFGISSKLWAMFACTSGRKGTSSHS